MYATVAQLGEHSAEVKKYNRNRRVVGSNPTRGINLIYRASAKPDKGASEKSAAPGKGKPKAACSA